VRLQRGCERLGVRSRHPPRSNPPTVPPPDAAALARTLLPRFTASGYEHPGFAQLHALCPAGIATGGAGRTEMGAFAQLGGPIRLANLRVALGDTLRVGLEAGLFTVT